MLTVIYSPSDLITLGQHNPGLILPAHITLQDHSRCPIEDSVAIPADWSQYSKSPPTVICYVHNWNSEGRKVQYSEHMLKNFRRALLLDRSLVIFYIPDHSTVDPVIVDDHNAVNDGHLSLTLEAPGCTDP